MTFLELVQDLARETGTMENADPINGEISTLQDPDNDYLIDLIRWTRKAWVAIQLESDWDYLIKQGEVTTTADQDYVDVASQVSDFRLLLPYIAPYGRRWISIDDREPVWVVRYPRWAGWNAVRQSRNARPRNCTILPDGQSEHRMKLWPTPNKVYTITFDYIRTPQELSADDDEPAMPARFHDAIVYRAMVKYAGYDEASPQYQRAKTELAGLMIQMRLEHLPQMRVAGTR